MSWRAIVVDDEKPARERLKRLLANHDEFEVVGEAADVDAAVQAINELEPDLCFLDVRMPGGDGFDIVQRIDVAPRIVFTTAYDEYAVRAFEVRSIDYLLKPFSKSRFAETLDKLRGALNDSGGDSGNAELLRAIESLKKEREQKPAAAHLPPARVTAKRGAKILVLSPAEIRWFEADETLVFARTTSGRVLVERTLTDLEQTMGPTFFRSHRRYLVNLAYIREILPGDAGTYEIAIRDEERDRVPLSRRQARKLRELIPW
jgi:DNA-binding LytR/AlgR family response regulator